MIFKHCVFSEIIYGKKCITAKIQKSSEEVSFFEGLDKYDGAIEVGAVDLTFNKSCKSVRKGSPNQFQKIIMIISLHHKHTVNFVKTKLRRISPCKALFFAWK